MGQPAGPSLLCGRPSHSRRRLCASGSTAWLNKRPWSLRKAKRPPTCNLSDGSTRWPIASMRATITFTPPAVREREYRVVEQEVVGPTQGEATADVQLKRWVNPLAHRFYAGDHHIHAAGCARAGVPRG